MAVTVVNVVAVPLDEVVEVIVVGHAPVAAIEIVTM
jgi:hypothetical protein